MMWIRLRGAQGIVVSGGEPTIHKDIVRLLSYAKGLGLSVVMSTHGQIRQRVLACAPFTDWIALPVDGVTNEMLTAMRGKPWSLAEAHQLIAELRHTNPSIRIKLGTVANRQNLHEIKALGQELVTRQIPIDTWKIYQYTARRKFAHRAEAFRISDADYRSLCDSLKAVLAASHFETVFSSNQSRRRAYVFVYPDGSVVVPNVGEAMTDAIVGNAFVEGEAVFDRIAGFDPHNHDNNYRSTYGVPLQIRPPSPQMSSSSA